MSTGQIGRAMVAASSLLLLPIAGSALAQGTTFSLAERGRYLVTAGDCAACHTADGGKPFAGNRPVPTPFGTIYSANLTPDPDTGIGKWSDADFYRAMHDGLDDQGNHLYPAFPYPSYTKVSVEDVRAIKAYLDTLPAVKQETKSPELPWPLSMREVMAGWNALYFHEGTYQSNPNKSAQWNRGAYLVEGLGHCGACHTPRNIVGASKMDDRLQGGYGEHWYAVSLTGDLRGGLGAWSSQDVVEYLKTGSNSKAAAAGPMAEVVHNSTQHLSDGDLAAIATYLKDIPPDSNQRDAKAVKVNDKVASHGAALYLDNCAGCHMDNGEGLANVFPPLKASAPVQSDNAATVLEAVIGGANTVVTQAKPTGLAMPAFGWKLSDREIADLATYIRNAWGNRASVVTTDQVAKVREEVAQSASRSRSQSASASGSQAASK